MNAFNRVLKEPITADRDFPPFDRVSMDGVAVDIEVFNKGQREFNIEGVQAAGSEQLTLKNPSNCIEVMTGAVMPKNADAVIKYELTETIAKHIFLKSDALKQGDNVHKQGSDCAKGTLLLEPNILIGAAEIGILASVGKNRVRVAKQPKICVISTGDELVEVSQTPLPHQIRRSNVFTLEALLKRLNLKSTSFHIKDNKAVLKQNIEDLLNHYDVLLLSGSVSKGKFDFIPEVLNELGVKKRFHQVKQRPGKPFWFGKKGDKTIFAFPGNPVSTFVNCVKYFYPWYYKSVGLNFENKQQAILSEDFYFKPEMTYFLQVKLTQVEGKLMATPISGNGSGDLANLALTDAFLELPDNRSNFTKGEVFPILRYRSV
ncbi:MAG: molybdopterin molybdenumtransferase MoeA [Flavobacteriales bacterium CG_4_10_14_0_2_um_filter_35_18]|nr:MAG: molybdopterin molybdenumtransferase MoeA [Flavobacteriales bacterium CG_4_10_14_0_2_um_filter_35_18]